MDHYKVKDLMVPNPVVIDPDTSLKETAEKMLLIDCGIMPVGTPDKLVGMVSDRDITIRAVARGMDPVKTKAREVMTNKVFYVSEDDGLDLAVDLIKKHKINRLLVKDVKGKLSGILSLSGLIRETSDADALTEFVQSMAKKSQRQAA